MAVLEVYKNQQSTPNALMVEGGLWLRVGLDLIARMWMESRFCIRTDWLGSFRVVGCLRLNIWLVGDVCLARERRWGGTHLEFHSAHHGTFASPAPWTKCQEWANGSHIVQHILIIWMSNESHRYVFFMSLIWENMKEFHTCGIVLDVREWIWVKLNCSNWGTSSEWFQIGGSMHRLCFLCPSGIWFCPTSTLPILSCLTCSHCLWRPCAAQMLRNYMLHKDWKSSILFKLKLSACCIPAMTMSWYVLQPPLERSFVLSSLSWRCWPRMIRWSVVSMWRLMRPPPRSVSTNGPSSLANPWVIVCRNLWVKPPAMWRFWKIRTLSSLPQRNGIWWAEDGRPEKVFKKWGSLWWMSCTCWTVMSDPLWKL